jgi:hypothetical protein
MKSQASTPAAYLASLPPDRRGPISTLRRFIIEHLDPRIQECMQHGVLAFCIPHTIWPHGHHTNPALPLMYMGLSSQKNDMVVYMLCLYQNQPMREWFNQAWTAAGKKLNMPPGGGGCCLRFKKLDELSLNTIRETIRRIPVQAYLDNHAARLADIRKDPDAIRQSARSSSRTPKEPGSKWKKTKSSETEPPSPGRSRRVRAHPAKRSAKSKTPRRK